MRIDVHAHYLPPAYAAVVARARGSDWTPGPIEREQGTPQQRVELLDAANVDLQVLSLGRNSPYLDREADAVAAAQIGNDAYATITSEHAGRLAAFGSIPLPHLDAAMREVERCLDELHMLGITLGCSIGERTLDEPWLEPLWAELNRRHAVVFLHPTFRTTDPHLRDYGLDRMAGACFEDTLAALRLVLSGLTVRNPNVRIIVPHFGGTLPTIYPRVIHAGKADLLRSLYYDTANGYGPALRCACEALGADRLMLGSDFPYIGSIKRNVDYVTQAGLSVADQQLILDTTAAQVLGLRTAVHP